MCQLVQVDTSISRMAWRLLLNSGSAPTNTAAYNDAAGAYEAGADYTALKDEYDAAVAAFEAVQKDLTRYKDMIAAYEAMLDKDNDNVADKGDTYKAALKDAQES